MLTLLFLFLMLGFLGKGIQLAFRMTWGLVKIALVIVFFPLMLIGMVLAGLVSLALPLLVIGGIATFLLSSRE